MRIKLIHIVIALAWTVFPSDIVFAQKKKKQQDETSASTGIKSREAEFYFTEAEKFFILEDYAKALVYYQKALDILPENGTIHYKIAEVLSRGGKQDDLVRASLSIEQALKYERKNKYFFLLGASINANLTRFDKSAQLYETMLQEIPGTEEYLFELALVYQYSNNQAEALKTYTRAESFFGINETSSFQKQRIYLEQGKIAEAIEEGEKLLKAFPEEEQYAVGLAELLSQQNQTGKAITLLENFRKEVGTAPNATVLLSALYRDAGREEDARQLLRKVFDDPSVDVGSKLIVLGTYNAELNQNKEKNVSDLGKENFVLELFIKLEKDYPTDENIHILGGDLYLAIGKNVEAERQYAEAIRLTEVNFEVWQNLLYLQTQREAFDEVINNSEKALEYFPNQSMLHYFNGLAHLRKHHYNEAAAALEMGKKLSVSNPAMTSEINSMLGEAYNGAKQYEKSDNAFEESLVFNPNNYIVINNYSYYLALRKASLDKAEKMSSHLIKDNPDNATFLDTHAWVLYARQKYREAKKIMERVIASGQANSTHYEHYGDILFKLGEIDMAVQQWEKAKSMLNGPNETLNKKIANRKIYE